MNELPDAAWACASSRKAPSEAGGRLGTGNIIREQNSTPNAEHGTILRPAVGDGTPLPMKRHEDEPERSTGDLGIAFGDGRSTPRSRSTPTFAGNSKMSLTVVLDSNIWLNEQMLRHSVGSAVRFFLRRHNARVVVPEVVRLEVELHLEKELKELASRLREGHRRLLGLVGELKEQVLPTDEELTVVASTAFANAGIEIHDFPFSLDSARASFEKTIRSEPPSGPKNQQFKDGVIWADCLKLAMDSPVLFVTQDKAFYKARDYKKGLADNLAKEAQRASLEISISHDISSILERIRAPISIDYSLLHSVYYPIISDRTERLIGSEGYELAELLSGDHTVFATNDPNVGHVEFSLRYNCVHPTLSDGLLVAKGECVIDSVSGDLTDFRNRGEEFHFVNAEGEQQKRNVVLGVGSIVLGHRTVQHSVRALLDA